MTRKERAMQAFTDRLTMTQQRLVREEILRDALVEAERYIINETKYRVMPHWSYVGRDESPQKSISNAVFWAHAKLDHLWKVQDDGNMVMVPRNEL